MTKLADGWIVLAGKTGRSTIKRQFLVAMASRDKAVAAVQKMLEPDFTAEPHVKLDSFHMTRRGMDKGDILELGPHSSQTVRKQKVPKR